MSSRIVTIFMESAPLRRGPSPFVVSTFAHGFVIGALYFGLSHSPRVQDGMPVRRYTVRLMDPILEKPAAKRAGGGGAAKPLTRSSSEASLPGGNGQPHLPVATHVEDQPVRLQTLLQPDAPLDQLLPKEIKVPTVVMWSPETTSVSKLVPLPAQPPKTVEAKPVIQMPNHELNVADVKLASTIFPMNMPVMTASVTVPVVVRAPEPAKQVPQAAAVLHEQPTPARVISLSDLHPAHGTIVIPLANQTANAARGESLNSGPTEKSQAASGNAAEGQDGNRTGIGAGGIGDKVGAKAGAGDSGGHGGQGSAGGTGIQNGPGSSAGTSGRDTGASTSNGLNDGGPSLGGSTVTRITRPRDGQYGVVVVGSSLAEQYPETVTVWSGRLVYTVYLRVGAGKNWILQYALPRSIEAAAAGDVARPEAPWPYEIVRPDLAPGEGADGAMMVHGSVDLTGHFQQLAMILPQSFLQARFVLNALQQWHFRPARQAGQPTAVEVLLIIPEDSQ